MDFGVFDLMTEVPDEKHDIVASDEEGFIFFFFFSCYIRKFNVANVV
jgi:hypothetical protein